MVCVKGSNVGMTMVVVNVIQDKFSTLKHWQIVIPVSIVQFMCGLIYLTPVGTAKLFVFMFQSHLVLIPGRSTHPEFNRFLWSIVRCTGTCCTRTNNIWMDLRC